MPMTYILQQLNNLRNETNRLGRDYLEMSSRNRKEIKELKNRMRLLEQSHSTETTQERIDQKREEP